jgi:predicted phosphodiesterase
VTLLHGNQLLNTVYVHEERPDAFLEKLGSAVGARSGNIVCIGHTHIAWHRIVNGVHFINTGSVGRPKDGDWRAGWVLLEIPASNAPIAVEFVRVPYDVERAVQAIVASDLPNDFADFLRTGGSLTALADG